MVDKIATYKDLIVWQKAKTVSILIYKLTKNFTKEELFGLTSQLRRASISIPANIAEGKGRSSNKDYAQFLHISLGSSLELETELLIAKELGYGIQQEYNQIESLITEIQKILTTLIIKLKS